MINKIGLIMGFVGLALSIVWGYMYYDNKRRTRELLQKGEQTLAMVEELARIRQDSILYEVEKRDSAIKNLEVAQKVAKESLNSSLREGRRLSTELRKAKVERDTVLYYTKCDSLTDQIAVLEAENGSYQEKVDLLNLSYQKQLSSKDSLIRSKDELYGKLREAFSGSVLKRDELIQQNRELNLKLEKSKRTTRLVAVIGAAVAGTVYVTTR